jgi:ribosomal protein S18 acetylase RimI-like enzyme
MYNYNIECDVSSAFLIFIESLKTEFNKNIIESIENGYHLIYESDNNLLRKWIYEPHGRICVYSYNDDNSTAYISSLYVDPDNREAGSGKRLLTKAEEFIKNNGFSHIMLLANKKSWVYDWYISLGYKQYSSESDNNKWLIKDL